MKNDLQKLKKEFEKGINEVVNLFDLEKLEQKFFSRKSGLFTEVMKNLKNLDAKARREFGKFANEIKKEFEEMLLVKQEEIRHKAMDSLAEIDAVDITQVALPPRIKGHIHPITQTLWELESIARSMGFIIEDGPEIESYYYIFDALNIPEHHPARDAQDTFYIKGHSDWTMRSHVSGMQVRQMRQYGAPLRAVHLGRVFRNEAVDATHGHTFYQFDCIVIDKNLSIGHLVGTIRGLLESLYKRKLELRVRTGYFPFVEPGFEMEMKVTTGAGPAKKTKWTEVVAGGMVHPNVIKAGGLDPARHDGFAFSFGLDRLVMAKYGIEDIRHIHGGDLRFLEQF